MKKLTVPMEIIRITKTREAITISLMGKTEKDDGLIHADASVVLEVGTEGKDVNIGDEVTVTFKDKGGR